MSVATAPTRVYAGFPEDIDFTLYDTQPYKSGKTSELSFFGTESENPNLEERNVLGGPTKIFKCMEIQIGYLWRGLTPVATLMIKDLTELVRYGYVYVEIDANEHTKRSLGGWHLSELFPGGDYGLLTLLFGIKDAAPEKKGKKLGVPFMLNPLEKVKLVIKWPSPIKLQTGPWDIQARMVGFARRCM